MNKSGSRLAEIAVATIVDTANLLKDSGGYGTRVYREEGRDIKLEADIMLSHELVKRLEGETGYRCITEEDADTHEIPNEDPVWIVDPLDGSMNFAMGVPLYCISVALWRKAEPVIGVIYDVERKKTFVSHGGRSLADGRKMCIADKCRLEKAVLATGIALLAETTPEGLRWLFSFAESFKKVRMLGSAALSLAWVAEGRLDAYFEKDIMLWDVAAGALMVRNAGGACIMRPGKHPLSMDVLAANPILAEEMQKALGWKI